MGQATIFQILFNINDPLSKTIKSIISHEWLEQLFIYLFEILKTLTMSHTFTRKGAEVIKCLNTTK